MVAPPFVPKCITPKYLAHGKEGEATPTTIVGILRPLSYMMDTLPHWFFWPSVMVVIPPSLVHNKGLAQGEEGKTTPTTKVGILLHSLVDYHVWSLDRLKVNPKFRLIIFLENPGHSIFPTYSSTSHAKIHEKSGMTFAKKDISSAWNLLERKLINIPAKHRPLGAVLCKMHL